MTRQKRVISKHNRSWQRLSRRQTCRDGTQSPRHVGIITRSLSQNKTEMVVVSYYYTVQYPYISPYPVLWIVQVPDNPRWKHTKWLSRGLFWGLHTHQILYTDFPLESVDTKSPSGFRSIMVSLKLVSEKGLGVHRYGSCLKNVSFVGYATSTTGECGHNLLNGSCL